MADEADTMAQAHVWAARARDPDFEGWADLTAWLEADASHLEAYERAHDVDAWALEALSLDSRPFGRSRS